MLCSIIIVSYNTKKLLKQCIDSIIMHEDGLDYEIIVVDNASSDGSVQMIKKDYPRITLISNSSNLGFAKANNIGVKQAKGKYVLLLNSDTSIRSPSISLFLKLARSHRSAISGCQLMNPDGTIQPQGGSLPNLINVLTWMWFIDDLPLISNLIPRYQQRNRSCFTSDHQMGWVGGTALLVDRNIYQDLQGLDENIFMYGEDVEFCLRASRSHIPVQYFHQPQITHYGHASGSSGHAILGEYKGLIYIYKKHEPSWKLALLRLLLISGAYLRVMLFGIIGQDEQKRHYYYQAAALARS